VPVRFQKFRDFQVRPRAVWSDFDFRGYILNMLWVITNDLYVNILCLRYTEMGYIVKQHAPEQGVRVWFIEQYIAQI
jgi:hypothetical protein